MKKIIIPGLKREEIVLIIRKHSILVLLSFIYLFIIIFLTIIFLGYLYKIGVTIYTWRIIVILLSVHLLILTTFVLREWIKYTYDIMILTKYGIIKIEQRGILNRKVFNILLNEIRNISASYPTIFHTLVKHGNITFELKNDIVVFSSLYQPIESAEKILELRNIFFSGKKGVLLRQVKIPLGFFTEFSTRDIEKLPEDLNEEVIHKEREEEEIAEKMIKAQTEAIAEEIVDSRSLNKQENKGWLEIFLDQIFGSK